MRFLSLLIALFLGISSNATAQAFGDIHPLSGLTHRPFWYINDGGVFNTATHNFVSPGIYADGLVKTSATSVAVNQLISIPAGSTFITEGLAVTASAGPAGLNENCRIYVVMGEFTCQTAAWTGVEADILDDCEMVVWANIGTVAVTEGDWPSVAPGSSKYIPHHDSVTVPPGFAYTLGSYLFPNPSGGETCTELTGAGWELYSRVTFP